MFYSYTHHLFKENSFFLLRSWSCCVAVPEHELKKLREVTTKKKKIQLLSLTLILTTTVRLCSSYPWNCLPSACTHIKYNSVVGYHFWFCLQCLLVSLLPYIFCHTKHSCTEKKNNQIPKRSRGNDTSVTRQMCFLYFSIYLCCGKIVNVNQQQQRSDME